MYKDVFPPVHGGIEQHIALLASLQSAAGHDVDVLVAGATGPSEHIERDGYRVTRLSERGRAASSPLTLGFAVALRRSHAEIVHFHHPNPVAEVFAPLLPKSSRIAVSYHADITRQRLLGAVYRPMLRRLLDRASVLITGSDRLRDTSPLLAPHRTRCHVVPYGVPPAARGPDLERDMSRILFVGRWRAYKGLLVLVRALAELPGIELRLVGGGPMEAQLRALAGQLGVTDRITMLGDLPAEDLDREYRTAAALVLPSIQRSEAFGIVLVEALHRGTPLVTTELGTGTSWVNRDGLTGRVVTPGDPLALASAIRELCTNRAAWDRYAAGAVERARDFAPERMLEGTMAAYASALRRGQRRN